MPSSTIICLLSIILAVTHANIIGEVESANPLVIRGWACDPAYPISPVTVEARENFNLLGSTLANISRPDKAAQCGGNSATGFEIQFPSSVVQTLLTGAIHTVTVNGLLQTTTIAELLPLQGSPVSIQVQTQAQSYPRGFLDVANSAYVAGWACDPQDTMVPLTIDFLVDGQLMASTVADAERESAVGQQCGGNSYHGFYFNFPQSVVNLLKNGQAHTVAAFALGVSGATQLSNSPIAIPALPGPPPMPIGTLEPVNLNTLTGWACDPLRPDVSLQVTIVIDGNPVGSTVANVGRETAVAVQCGQNNLHGFEFPIPQNIRSFLMIGTHQIAAFLTPANGGNLVQLNSSPRMLTNGFP